MMTNEEVKAHMDMLIAHKDKALETHPYFKRCDSCIHSEERDGSNCYECIKGMSDNFEEQPKTSYISIDVTKFAKGVAEKVLDEITYEGKTVREWAEIIVKQQPSEIHCEFSDENVAKAFIEDVESVKDKLPKSSEDCRNCKKWNKCPCGKEGHENGTSIGYSIGECKDYEPSEDAVSREAVLSLQTEYAEKMDATTFWKLRDDIRALPPVKPERPKGKWIYKEYDERTGIGDSFFCSECGEPRCMKLVKYCPNCGSYNGGEEDGDSN